jgi:lipopolysaccharide biosynthesis glycosyltransferase
MTGGYVDTSNKKPWTTPELIQYGSVEELTQQAKWKQIGTSDDFGVPGISSP